MTTNLIFRIRPAAVCLAVLVAGCASVSGPPPKADPLESFNRAAFEFNESLDNAVLKPVAQGYVKVAPEFVRSGIGNVFENVSDVATAVNNLLQGKVANAASDTGRVLVNTTLGIFGLWDVASPLGLEKHNEDFGQTLGKWGVGSGPYLVLPLLGPSTVRDGLGRIADSPLGYWPYVDPVGTRNSLYVTDAINTRARLLGAGETLDTAALDKYTFLRDAYLQRRLNQVFDGKVPQEKLDDLEESLEPPAIKK
jgi:phospholipid-binding lipoprotein MlaA